MKFARSQSSRTKVSNKAPTGILGFDKITGGGLPSRRTTLLVGGPGSGKTIFALQFLVHGARQCKEPGIFVAFEESAERIVSNAESFGWDVGELRPKNLYFMDAQPMADMVQSGNFDLGGMLAALDAKIQQMGARRIVFDALDVVLALLPDASAKRVEICRLHEWLLARNLSGVITAKAHGGEDESCSTQQPFGFMQFMVDCAVILNHSVVQSVSQRNLRVQKYRGSSFDENESPFLIGAHGLEVDAVPGRTHAKVSTERVSSGVDRLDTMLGGGYYRGASVLITGFPGTAKTTLSGAFAEAACARGERTLFISFDSDSNEVVRDLASVGIRLERFLKNGLLRLASARTITGSAETYLVRVKTLATEHAARCLVIDPMATWARSGSGSNTHSVAERLTDWAKANSITLVCTSQLDEMSGKSEGGPSSLQIPTLADTWIQLSYLIQAGERNRGLSIIKSRGTAHSNQVRELVLSDAGVTLTDTYTAGGEVLMGTLRWEKESSERAEREVKEVAARLRRVKLDAEEAELEVRVKSLQVELEAKQVEKALMIQTVKSRAGELSRGRTRIEELRGADILIPGRK